MNLSGSLVMLATLLPGQQPGASFYEDFRGRPLPASVELVGPDASSLVTTDSGGIRITIPADHPSREVVGIRTVFKVGGNFDMAAGYELINVEQPSEGLVGLEFFIHTPSNEALAFYRGVRSNGEETFSFSRNTNKTPDGKRRYIQSHFPATAKSGRLRIARQGSELTCWAAEGAEGDYRELARFDFEPDDLRMIRLTAYRRNSPRAVDLRIADLKISTDAPIANLPPALAAAQEPGAKSSLVLVLIVTLVIIGMLAVSAAFYVWRRRRAPAGPAGAISAAKAPARTSFACSNCGKPLKTTVDLAGRKAKCSQCGAVVVVPPARVDAPSTGPR
jgi:hypothetical protein